MEEAGELCLTCYEKVKNITGQTCIICGTGLNSVAHICGSCIKNRPQYEYAKSLFVYNDVVRQLIHSLKYQHDSCSLTIFSWLSDSLYLNEFSAQDFIVPVPLHKQRLVKRGYNQATLISKALFPRHKQKIRNDILLRNRNTKSQIGLSGLERRQNLSQAFQVKSKSMVVGRSFCLVDDVFTTGTTVNECARCLLDNGATRVVVLTLARVVSLNR